MSDRTPEDYERALRAVVSITMDTLRGESPFECDQCDREVCQRNRCPSCNAEWRDCEENKCPTGCDDDPPQDREEENV